MNEAEIYTCIFQVLKKKFLWNVASLTVLWFVFKKVFWFFNWKFFLKLWVVEKFKWILRSIF